MDMHNDGAVAEGSHGIEKNITESGLYNIFHKLWAVGIKTFPFLGWADAFLGDAGAAELVRTELRLHIGQVSAGRKCDKKHATATGEGKAVFGSRVLIFHSFCDSMIYSPPELYDVWV